MSRIREFAFRLANSALLGSSRWLLRRYRVETSYKVSSDGIAALFEECWFRYDPAKFGATGNLDFHGEGENTTRHKLLSLLKANDVFYDIGAHGGVYSITARKRFPTLEVHSFEPQPADLKSSLALNGMSIASVHGVALGETSGAVKMTSGNRSSNYVTDDGDVEVKMVRLDDYRRENSLPAPNWIKIDIEGFELSALRGGEATLRESRPTIICEINNLNARYGVKTSDLASFMQSLGYGLYRLFDDRFIALEVSQPGGELPPSADGNYWFVTEEAISQLGFQVAR